MQILPSQNWDDYDPDKFDPLRDGRPAPGMEFAHIGWPETPGPSSPADLTPTPPLDTAPEGCCHGGASS